jgi:uracil-DNA glycosylase
VWGSGDVEHHGVKGMTEEEKKREMRKLVELRRTGWVPEGCYRLGDKEEFNNGFWDDEKEDEFVVPWSKGACNYSAKVMVIAQDWDSYENLSVPLTKDHHEIKRVGRNVDLKTNTRLDDLLDRHFNRKFKDTFATDVFPFIKKGGMDARLKWADLVRCAHDFALRQIEIIDPLMVICLGRATTFRAIARAIPDSRIVRVGDNPLGPIKYNKVPQAEIYGVTHPGGWGNNWQERIEIEWSYLANRFRQICEGVG